MDQFRSFTANDAVRVAEAALAVSTGELFAIQQVRDLGGEQRRNLILRANATSASGIAKSIIIKVTRAAGYDPTSEKIYQTSGLVKEWAASTFLAKQAARAGLRGTLLAADVARGVLIFEDYGEDLGSLVQPLLHGSADDAERALTAYAVALAQLHAGTIGCRKEHSEIVRAAFPAATMPTPGEGWIDGAPRKVVALLGGRLPRQELSLMAKRLRSPGPWLTLVHRDPCPDNVLLAADGTAKLIDFEFSSPGHALLDAAYWWMGFPTCWCAGRVPDALGQRIDTAYRAALADSIPAAVDRDAFERERAIICVIWLLGSLEWLLDDAFKDDTDWGLTTRRTRILHYLTTAIRMAADADVLRGTRETANAWLDNLRERWPASSPLALYPAFMSTAAPSTSSPGLSGGADAAPY